MGVEHVRSEIEHMRVQVGRQRKEILQLQRAGIGTASAELLLLRMLAKIEGLCDERDRLKKEQGGLAGLTVRSAVSRRSGQPPWRSATMFQSFGYPDYRVE